MLGTNWKQMGWWLTIFGQKPPAWPAKSYDYSALQRIPGSLHLHKQEVGCGNQAAPKKITSSNTHGSETAVQANGQGRTSQRAKAKGLGGVPPRQQLPGGRSRNVLPARKGGLCPSCPPAGFDQCCSPYLQYFPFLLLMTGVYRGYSPPTSAILLHVNADNFFFFNYQTVRNHI